MIKIKNLIIFGTLLWLFFLALRKGSNVTQPIPIDFFKCVPDEKECVTSEKCKHLIFNEDGAPFYSMYNNFDMG